MQVQLIQEKIYEIRGLKVLLDYNLAELYEVETRVLKQAVRRNIDRFPEDFMPACPVGRFQLSTIEVEQMVSQNVIPSKSYLGGALSFAFTEQGVAMLSSVLKSKKALQVNIAIMRAFVFIRQYALSHKDLTEKLTELETRYNEQFRDVYEAINYLLQKDKREIEQKERRKIGFKTE